MLGSYDHSVQLWSRENKKIAGLSGHNGAVKAVAWLAINEANKSSKYNFISGAHDQSIIIWEYDAKAKKVEKTTKCVGHKESVECLAVNSDKTKVS